MGREYVFKDDQAKHAERMLSIRMEDDQVFKILPPALLPDEAIRNAVDNPLEAAEYMLEGGKEAYAAYKKAGGNAAYLAQKFEENFGESLPESQASSSS